MRAAVSLGIATALFAASIACSDAPRTAAVPVAPPIPVDGLIVALDEQTITIETSGGDRYAFAIADTSVPIEHLGVHQRDRLPVRITWEQTGSSRAATLIADVPTT